MNRKLILLDIDGTLTEPGKNIPPDSAVEAVKKARENGHKVLLCSGRNRGMLSPLLHYEWDGYIASSGGYVVCEEQVIFDCPMTDAQREKVLAALADQGIYCTVECLDGSFTDEAFKAFLRDHATEKGNSELLRWREQIEQSLNIRPLSEYTNEPCYKMVIMIPSEARVEEVTGRIKDEFHVVVQEGQTAGFSNGEVVNRLFDKGTGVRQAAEYFDIPLADTIGFGDSMNDLEMIQTVGLSICMANGAQALQEIADEVCPAVTEDGLYKAFDKHGLLSDPITNHDRPLQL